MRSFWAILLFLLSSGFASSQKTSALPTVAAKRTNIILITLDTTRADRMGFMGSHRGLTPNLDKLANQSVVFTRAYAQVPLTTPSHAGLLTGTFPQFNHIQDLGAPLAKDLPYLPDLLHGDGYHTAAFVGAEILDPISTAPGFDRGFDFYGAPFHGRRPGEDRYKSIERRAEDVANQATGWLQQHHEGPFFLWLHFYDPHDPYDPPEPFKARYANAPYDGEIAYTDSIVGGLIDVLQRHGLFQDCVIVIAADHGEAFGEHGEQRHGMFLYDETIHVPLLLKLPASQFKGKRVNQRVALADVAPTLLEAARIAIPEAMQAHSLLELIPTTKVDAAKANIAHFPPGARGNGIEGPVYSETNYGHRTFGWAELRSWRTEKYLYVHAPKRELYDQASDPSALRNRASTSKAVADTLDAQLEAFRTQTSSAPGAQVKLDPAQAEKLRALGYLAADGMQKSGDKMSEIDPKDTIEIANKFHRALLALEDDHFDEAIANLREVVRMDPELGSGYMELGRALAHSHRDEEALAALRLAAEKLSDSGMAHYEVGLLLVKAKDWDGALKELQAATEATPGSALLHFDLAAIYAHLKQRPEATAEYEKALEIDPQYFDANLMYGRLLLLEDHAEDALPRLQRAVKVDPSSPIAHELLADAYEKLGRPEDASREHSKAAELKVQNPE